MLTTNILGIKFKNPIIAASTDISREPDIYEALLKSGVGAVITKSVTDAKTLQSGELARFLVTDTDQTPCKGAIPNKYTLISRGGAMISMDELADKSDCFLTLARQYNTVCIASISAADPENWVDYAKEIQKLGFDAVELNFGNPHGEAADKKLGYLIGQSSNLCADICSSITSAVSIPVIAKLTPQLSDIAALAKLLEQTGIQALTIMHRYQGLMIDPETDEPVLGGIAAVGGPWMKPISMANIAKVAQAVSIPVFGGNGADTARDIYDYMLCGASMVEVGSSFMLRGFSLANTLSDGLKELMQASGYTNVNQLTGSLLPKLHSYKNLSSLPKERPVIDFEKCKNCKDIKCAEHCFFGALKNSDDTLIYNSEKCSGCGLCSQICNQNAIKMSQEC